MVNSNIGILLICAFLATNISASGSSDSTHVDKRYESGKALFLGRVYKADIKKFCLAGQVKANKAGIKSLNLNTPDDLVASLYDCANPDVSVSSVLNSQQVTDLVYYLNKRYRLGLK